MFIVNNGAVLCERGKTLKGCFGLNSEVIVKEVQCCRWYFNISCRFQ
jgi:hypothetical protein